MSPRIALLISTTALSLVGAAAHAQSVDPNWTGPYAGIHLGATLDNNRVGTGGLTAGNNAALTSNARPADTVLDRNGFVGGGQIGYNYQYGRFVGGLEADYSWPDADASNTYNGPVGTVGARQNSYISSKLDNLGTVRARLGYLITPRVLLYGTGGYAYGDVKYRTTFANAAGALAYSGSDNYTAGGYTYGAGVEYAYPVALNLLGHSSAVTLRAEWLHYDLGKKEVNVAAAGGGAAGAYTSNFKTLGDEVRAGVNFKF